MGPEEGRHGVGHPLGRELPGGLARPARQHDWLRDLDAVAPEAEPGGEDGDDRGARDLGEADRPLRDGSVRTEEAHRARPHARGHPIDLHRDRTPTAELVDEPEGRERVVPDVRHLEPVGAADAVVELLRALAALGLHDHRDVEALVAREAGPGELPARRVRGDEDDPLPVLQRIIDVLRQIKVSFPGKLFLFSETMPPATPDSVKKPPAQYSQLDYLLIHRLRGKGMPLPAEEWKSIVAEAGLKLIDFKEVYSIGLFLAEL